MVAVLTLLSNSPAYKQVSDEDAYLSCSTTIKANSKIVKERIWIAFQPSHPDTGALLFEECVVAMREEPNLHRKFYQRDVTDGIRSPWKFPVDIMVKVAQKLENTVRPVIGFGFHSAAMEDIDHEAGLLNEV